MTDTSATTEGSETPTPQGGGAPFLTLMLGGFLAAAIGYVAAYYGEFSLFSTDDGAQDELTQIVASQEARLDEIEALLGAPDEATARLDASEAGLAELQENLGSLAGNIDSLDERIGGVEAGVGSLAAANVDGDAAGNPSTFDPAIISELTSNAESLQQTLQSQIDDLSGQVSQLAASDQVAAVEQRLSDLSSQIEAQQGAIAEAQAAAQDETRRIATQAAISELRAALENGEPYSDTVGAYAEASGQDLPDALSAHAAGGVATLAALQDSFPGAARDALDASLAVTAGDGALDRLGAFIKSQTGARALNEREGSGPDAVLSRAEARLSEGNLSATLSELDGLPPEGRDAMSGWIDRATARTQAKAALAELSNSSTTN